MSDIQIYLLEADKNKKEASRIAAQTSQKLATKQAKLLDLIESLGEYLNNDEGTIRAKTMAYLSEVLAALPSKVLSLQHSTSASSLQFARTQEQRGQFENDENPGTLLCDFILSRVSDDTEGIGSCASALIALEERGQWDQSTAVRIMNTFIEYTYPLNQYRLHSERYPVLKLIDLLLAKYRQAIRGIHESSPDFLPRFISYFDGEKDPRNLMIVFSILKVPMTEWSITSDAQDLFDAVFNYFPITFRPPPDDPYGITAQQLKDRLRECIASTGEFAPYAFPALIDKLDSTSMNTKRDVLQTFKDCAANYGTRTIFLYAVTLWDCLKFEILNVQDEDLASQSLAALAEIARQLSLGSPDALASYLKPITKECNEHLEDAPTKQSNAAGRILQSIASSSAKACDFLVGGVLPNLFALYQSADSIAKRRGLLEVLTELILADSSIYGEWADLKPKEDEETPVNALGKFKGQALEVFSKALSTPAAKEVTFWVVAVKGLLELATVRDLLTDDEISRAIAVFNNIIIGEISPGSVELKTAALDALVKLACQRPQLVVDKAFPEFMAKLPDTDSDTFVPYISVLEAFAKLGTEQKVFSTVTVRLKNKMNAAVQQRASSTFVKAILSAILFAYSNGGAPESGSLKEISYYEGTIQPLLLTSVGPSHPVSPIFEDESVLDLVGRLCNAVLRQQPLETQREKFQELGAIFDDLSPDNLRAGISADSARKMVVTTHLLAAMRREIELSYPPADLLPALIHYALLDNLSLAVRMATLQQIALVVNKHIPTSKLKQLLEPLLYEPGNLISPNTLSHDSLRVIFAILKGLVLRNAPLLNTVLPKLLELLSDPLHGIAIARGFATLLQIDDILTKENHCMISGLHKQKLFNLVVPSITQTFRSADAETKKHCLIALTGVLRSLPFTIIEHELPALRTLLLQALDLEGEDDIKASTIDVLLLVLTENPKALEEHAGSLITRLLNTTAAKTSPPYVRMKALQCMALVPAQLRGDIVIPFRRRVIKQLTAALDDRKRVVRSEAVKCRSRWSGLDDFEED